MFYAVQIKLRLLKHFLLCALPVSLIFLANIGCANSLNQENYLECQLKLEEDRLDARQGEAYSYKSTSFKDCRSPAIYGIIDD